MTGGQLLQSKSCRKGRKLAASLFMTMGVALVPSVQNPISLEYQIYPPAIDTLVTGMLVSSGENATQCIAIFMMMPRFA